MMDTSFPAPRRTQYTGGSQAPSPAQQEEIERDTSLLRWWYSLTAPAPVPASASLQAREVARRGRITSATLLVVILLVLAAEPIGLFGSDKSLIGILLIPTIFYIIALVFNRNGKITTAGIFTIIGMEIGITLAIIGSASSGGFMSFNLPMYDLLVQAELVAVTLLPPASVILLVFYHSAFIIGTMVFLPRSAEYAGQMSSLIDVYGAALRPITLQIIVAVVLYLWVTSAYQALKRADRAEVIAEMERRELEQNQKDLALKQQLDEGIQAILNTHIAVANGDFSARAPLKKENVLWRIAYSLNNLLARLQSLNASESELQKTRLEARRLAEAIRLARQGYPLQLNRTGTSLDILVVELMSTDNLPSTPPSQRPPSGTLANKAEQFPERGRERRSTGDFWR
jgi:hypothetical protein